VSVEEGGGVKSCRRRWRVGRREGGPVGGEGVEAVGGGCGGRVGYSGRGEWGGK